MEVHLQHVNSGDLITATFMNGVVDAINELQAEIDGLGSSPPPSGPGAPVVTSTSPTPDVPVGTTLTINGQNFAVPAVLNTIMLGGQQLNDFVGTSTDRVLNVTVPGTVASPATLPLTVQTTAGTSTSVNVHVVPQVVPLVGAVALKNASGAVPAANVGDTIHLELTLDATAVNLPEQYHVVVTYQAVVGATAADWQNNTSYVGLDGSQTVNVQPTDPVTVGVDILVPTGAESVDVNIQAVSMHNDPASSSGVLDVPITVGQAGPPADPSIHLGFGTNANPLIHAQTYTGDVSGSGLAVKYGANPVVEMTLGVDNPGTYTVSAQIENADATIWAVTGLPVDIPFSAGQPAQKVHFNLHLVPTSAPATGDVTRFMVITANVKDSDLISNYLRFPIGGF